MSFAVTSSHRQAKHLPGRWLVTGGGTATSGAGAADCAVAVGVAVDVERARGRQSGRRARALRVLERAGAGHLARGEDVVGELLEHEAPRSRS